MAEPRELPYSQFNFLVDLGTGETDSAQAGFQEVTGLGMEITVAEYRAGNEKENAPRKVHGTYKVTDITLKRGVIGALDLYQWLLDVRRGDQEARRDITIKLMSEDHQTTALTWRLAGAFPTKYTGPSLNGKGTDVAVEELVLACERLEMV